MNLFYALIYNVGDLQLINILKVILLKLMEIVYDTGKDFIIEALKYHLTKPEQQTTVKTVRTTPREANKHKVLDFFMKIIRLISLT